MINRGIPIRVPKRQISTSAGEGRLVHDCEEGSHFWRVHVLRSPTDTAIFACPKCRDLILRGEAPRTNIAPDVWQVHVGLVIGSRQVQLRALECPRCQAIGRVNPGSGMPASPVPETERPKVVAPVNVGPQRFGVKALQCATCNAVRLVDPANGVIDTEIKMETGIHGLAEAH